MAVTIAGSIPHGFIGMPYIRLVHQQVFVEAAIRWQHVHDSQTMVAKTAQTRVSWIRVYNVENLPT